MRTTMFTCRSRVSLSLLYVVFELNYRQFGGLGMGKFKTLPTGERSLQSFNAGAGGHRERP